MITVFTTPGEINPLSFKIIGLSVKESKNPLGYFGSGMKLAIAILLRNGHSVKIVTKDNTYEFGFVEREFRGETFNLVTCNGEELGYSTDMGKHWQMWQAYRELVSNTIDEGGKVGDESLEHMDTTFIVEGDELHECYLNHDQYFLGDRHPIAKGTRASIYERKNDQGTLFYRGVKIAEVPNTMFDYELHVKTELTEDRTPASLSTCLYQLQCQVQELKDKSLLKRILTAAQGYIERGWSYWSDWSDEFTEVAMKIMAESPTSLNPSVFSMIKERNPETSFNKRESSDMELKMLETAVRFLKKVGYEVTAPIHHIQNDDNKNIAFVHRNEIYLTERAFGEGMFYLVTTLLEEHFHTKGFLDETRTFETHLLNRVVFHAQLANDTLL